jgi:hypothetical protein
VNNRDLKTFTVDIERSIRLSRRIPAGKILIAESGISKVETILQMKEAGFQRIPDRGKFHEGGSGIGFSAICAGIAREPFYGKIDVCDCCDRKVNP